MIGYLFLFFGGGMCVQAPFFESYHDSKVGWRDCHLTMQGVGFICTLYAHMNKIKIKKKSSVKWQVQ
jgi:hypothetical protein